MFFHELVRQSGLTRHFNSRQSRCQCAAVRILLGFIGLLYGSIVERDVFAAFSILFGFEIASLRFALGFWFFRCLRLLVHMGICVDCCCLGFACLQVYCAKSGARLRGKLGFVQPRCPSGVPFLAVQGCAILCEKNGERVMINVGMNNFPSENRSFREKKIWRKGWDSNPRWVAPRSISSRVP